MNINSLLMQGRKYNVAVAQISQDASDLASYVPAMTGNGKSLSSVNIMSKFFDITSRPDFEPKSMRNHTLNLFFKGALVSNDVVKAEALLGDNFRVSDENIESFLQLTQGTIEGAIRHYTANVTQYSFCAYLVSRFYDNQWSTALSEVTPDIAHVLLSFAQR